MFIVFELSTFINGVLFAPQSAPSTLCLLSPTVSRLGSPVPPGHQHSLSLEDGHSARTPSPVGRAQHSPINPGTQLLTDDTHPARDDGVHSARDDGTHIARDNVTDSELGVNSQAHRVGDVTQSLSHSTSHSADIAKSTGDIAVITDGNVEDSLNRSTSPDGGDIASSPTDNAATSGSNIDNKNDSNIGGNVAQSSGNGACLSRGDTAISEGNESATIGGNLAQSSAQSIVPPRNDTASSLEVIKSSTPCGGIITGNNNNTISGEVALSSGDGIFPSNGDHRNSEGGNAVTTCGNNIASQGDSTTMHPKGNITTLSNTDPNGNKRRLTPSITGLSLDGIPDDTVEDSSPKTPLDDVFQCDVDHIDTTNPYPSTPSPRPPQSPAMAALQKKWSKVMLPTGFRLNIKTVFPCVVIPIIKIRRSWKRVIFIMEILTLVRHFILRRRVNACYKL